MITKILFASLPGTKSYVDGIETDALGLGGIRRGRVISLEDLKPGIHGSIPSRSTTVMVGYPWARHISWLSTGLFTQGS